VNVSYSIGWYGFRFLFRVYFRIKVYDAYQVPSRGPVILAANHASFLDPPLVGAGLDRDIHYLARESLFRFPVFRTVLRNWNVVPVDRDGGGAAGLKAIIKRLLDGGGVVLFPEGTRTHDGQLQPARAGLGLVVLKSTAPVVPVRLFGTFEAYGRHHLFPRPKPVAVKYGQPMDFSALREEARSCSKERLKEIYQQISDEVMGAIGALEARAGEP
jgi:1-acyl-sn-glycerol-3-phosphate acyltransferase